MRRIVLNIDRLVLRGFVGDERDGIAEGLRAELGRLLATPDAARHLISQDGAARIRVAPIRLASGASPVAVGVRTAQGIAGVVGPARGTKL